MVIFQCLFFRKLYDVNRYRTKRANTLRKAGVKVIGQFVLRSTFEDLMRNLSSPDLIHRLAESIMAVI
jgi:hypothetical protein